MTENQNSKVDPIATRELISQGITMKRKESEMKCSQSEGQFVESERPNDESMSKDFQEFQDEKGERQTKAIMSRFSSVATP